MSEKKDINLDRRKILKASGISMAGLTGMSGSAVANDTTQTCQSCQKTEVLAEDQRRRIAQVEKKDMVSESSSTGAYIVSVDKSEGTVSVSETPKTLEASSVTTDSISLQSHNEVIERYDAQAQDLGGCPSIYSDHISFTLAVETHEKLDSLGDGLLEAALCGLVAGGIGSLIGTPIAGALAGAAGAVFCYLVGKLFLSHLINYGGRTFAIGAYDKNAGGILNEPELRTLSSSSYETGYNNLSKLVDVPGVHFETGEDISSIGPTIPTVPQL